MPCSPAQLEAARTNGAKSRGPVTAEGKAISRANSLRHGLTGQGIVLPIEDAQELERRLAAFEAAIEPRNELEAELTRRVAIASVRLGRAAEHEAAALAHRLAHAARRHDEDRLADVDDLIARISTHPETNRRRLLAMPEGLERLIAELERLRSDLTRTDGHRWDGLHGTQLLSLLGQRWTDVPVHRGRALTEAVKGDFRNLGGGDRPDLDEETRAEWALHELFHLINGEVEALQARLAGFDRAELERDRAGAPLRAMFDDSKEGILARKYEASSERSLFRAIRELRELRVAEPQVEEIKEEATKDSEESGSFFPEPAGEADAKLGLDPTPAIGPDSATRRRPDLARLARQGRRRGKSR